MSKYHSKTPDKQGYVDWSREENEVWSLLVKRQVPIVHSRACSAYIDGLNELALPTDSVPQLPAINQILVEATGWQCEPVPALINFDRFFGLLAEKKFPVATFIRGREELDYLQEPDYFHEIFGHCAMLTNKDFAQFTQKYGELGKQANHQQRVFLARLYWFTVEFGLVKEAGEMKIYGGGILSSPAEARYALESTEVVREKLSVSEVLRPPYRIDILQPIYYYLDSIAELYCLSQVDLMEEIAKAELKGLNTPRFEQHSGAT